MVSDVPTVRIYAGDSVNWPSYTFKSAAGVVRDFVAEGWTDWVAQWRAPAAAVTDIALNVDTELANVGTIRVSATPEDTTAMGGPGEWDLQATNGTDVKTWIRGKTQWTEDVTR